VVPGDLGGRLAQSIGLACQWMAVEFSGRDGQIGKSGITPGA
jgi:hypothetical protein